MAKKWADLKATLPPEVIEHARRKTEAMLAVIELNELRKARKLTQEQLADRLGIRQSNVSKLERRADLLVSTLREVVEAMGGELRVTARFPDVEYQIDPVVRAKEAAA
ncbi:MAG TPA: XRE family transcriptional regulator [Longimicrobium sp.]|jgi:transcriptional regulator with XRE-family HTH domain|nr:XRE family transcriptional regulator [Longimicrobium sp.]